MSPRAGRPWLRLAGCLLLTASGWGQAVPRAMTGEMPAASFSSAGKLTNVMVMSFSSSSVYDDNFSNGASRHESGAQQHLTATFGVQQSRRRLQWNLSYQPGVVVGAHSLLGNQFNQVFGATLEAQPAARWSLKLRQDYALTTDPFDRLGEAPLQPELSPLERPNQMAILPQLKRSSSFSGAGLSYRLSRHTTVGLNGSYALQRYGDYADLWAGPLINSYVASGGTYVSRQISRRYNAGMEYRLRSLTFSAHDMRTLTHAILSFHEFAVTANSSLVVYFGPEYARTRGQIFLARNTPAISASWSPAAGAIYSWSGMRNRVQLGYSRQISDGGGIQGAVRLNAGWVRLGRQLGRHWAADLGTELAEQTALPGTMGGQLRILRAGAGFRRELGRNVFARLSYDRLYPSGATLGYRPGNHNRVMLSIEHSFMRPLGR
jgi:hypothetical protein